MSRLGWTIGIQGLLVGLFLFSTAAFGQTRNITPYAQADTSSPQATLRTFLESLEQNLAVDVKVTLARATSDRLYPNATEKSMEAEGEQAFLRGLETMDLSGLPSGFFSALAVEKLVVLAEVLARVDIPPLDDVPTHEAMKAAGETRWRIPNSPIEIARITEGPREGEYLFSARTILRLEEFHASFSGAPYKPGSVQRFVDAFRPHTPFETLYDIYSHSIEAWGLFPVRWLLNMPTWLLTQIFGVSLLKWLLLLVYAFVGYSVVRLTRFICRRKGSQPEWRLFYSGIVTCAFAWFMIPVCAQFHISGNVLYVLGVASIIVLFLVGAWTVFAGASAISETIIGFQRLRDGGIDSQLIRLGARFIGLVIAIAILVEGADELGLPSYSVLASIGVGGLAIAFAARETLANLLGSIVIVLEKPFRSGHWIKVGDAEGMVEYIGFRSTRIRSFGDSLVSIPNGTIVNSVVDNLGVRGKRRQCFSIQIAYDTPRHKVEVLVERIRKVVKESPMTDKDTCYINLNEFGENGLSILLYFYFRVGDFGAELQAREGILLQILELAEELEVAFSAPTLAQFGDNTEKSEMDPVV